MKIGNLFFILVVVISLSMTGCTATTRLSQPLDIRKFKIEQSKGGKDPLRIVVGVKDFDGLFSEEYRSDSLLLTEDRKRWRDMGVKTFPDTIASYLRTKNVVLDTVRSGFEASDIILEAELKKFRQDLDFETTMITTIYGPPLYFDTWKINSMIDGNFRLITSNGREVAKFTIKKQMPELVEKRHRVVQAIDPSRMPPVVEEKVNKVSRAFFKEVLIEVESKILEAKSKFSFLERPDLAKAQNLSDKLLIDKPRNQWAVVIGISRYFRGGEMFPDLQYADRDAIEFGKFLISPEGGGFKKDRVLLLTNADATYSSIRHALFTFLKDAQSEDLVIIYFAGHGAPDPDRTDNLYLIPYDVEPDNLSGSALPMWDIEKVLWKTILAQRVIVFIDSCHSAGVAIAYGTRGTKAAPADSIYNRYFRRLSHIRPGRVVFSSSNGYEPAFESAKWNKHGVFTWALLKALNGEADGIIPGTKKDQIVSLQEAIEYVKDLVVKETKGKQHPFLSASPKYDTELPLSVVSNRVQKKAEKGVRK